MISCILRMWININLITVKKKHLFTGIRRLSFVPFSGVRVILILCFCH